MKKSFTKFISISFCVIVGLGSCKKDAASNNSAALVGNWTLSEYGADANSNNSLDQGETASATQVGISGTINFKSDKTFTATLLAYGSSDTEIGTYSYANNVITTVSSGDTTAIMVNSLTNNKMVLKDPSTSPAQWVVYTK